MPPSTLPKSIATRWWRGKYCRNTRIYWLRWQLGGAAYIACCGTCNTNPVDPVPMLLTVPTCGYLPVTTQRSLRKPICQRMIEERWQQRDVKPCKTRLLTNALHPTHLLWSQLSQQAWSAKAIINCPLFAFLAAIWYWNKHSEHPGPCVRTHMCKRSLTRESALLQTVSAKAPDMTLPPSPRTCCGLP